MLTEAEGISAEVWTRGTSAEQVRDGVPIADPLVDRHRRELAESRALVVIHPDWLGKPPAILTGWLDRVLLAGAGTPGRARPAPNLQRALIINTHDRTTTGVRPESDPIGLLWREQIGPFLGSPEFELLSVHAGPSEPTRWLNAARRASAWVCGAAR